MRSLHKSATRRGRGYARFDEGEERRVERVGLLDLVRLLAEEEHTLVNHLAHDETEQLSEVETRDLLLEALLARLV